MTEPFRSPLEEAVHRRAQAALAAGALLPPSVDREVHMQDGLPLVVYVLRGRDRKVEDLLAQKTRERSEGRRPNPFLPYEPAMEVAPLTDTHVLLLNKFPVVPRHGLLVTRAFEHQDTALTAHDFSAAWRVLQQWDALVFYNGGTTAGASQPHKHLQVVPFHDTATGPRFPLEPLFAARRPTGAYSVAPGLPFAHLFADGPWPLDADAGTALHACYRRMMRRLALVGDAGNPGPYNLLMTRRWLLVVPRSRETWAGFGMNGLGFIGSFFVRRREELARLLALGPLRLLREVGYAR